VQAFSRLATERLESMRAIAQVETEVLHTALRSDGLMLDLGAASLLIRSTSMDLAHQLSAVYSEFPFVPRPAFADIHIDVSAPRSWRCFFRPQVVLRCDGEQPFHPFPADTALPLMEWGTNWLIGQRLHHLLLLHAGCLERDGFGLLLPATPGSGKSTLSAALAHRGWRLLSDEFGVCDPSSGQLLAMLKPVALKNRSIDVIRRFAPQAVIGPTFPKTRKGAVAHVAANADAVARRAQGATPAVVILPKWSEGSATKLEPLVPEDLLRALAFNAFNYEVLGATGFQTVLGLVRQCRGWRLEYGDLHDAVSMLETMWSDRKLMPSHIQRRGPWKQAGP
jgi:HprK-related kinase A